MKILIVDDEKLIVMAIQRAFKKSGHDAQTAYNGIEALQILTRSKNDGDVFNFIFLDLIMPELHGSEVLDWVKKNTPQTKVIMMTALGDSATISDLKTRGADLIIHKPFDDIFKLPELLKQL